MLSIVIVNKMILWTADGGVLRGVMLLSTNSKRGRDLAKGLWYDGGGF